jgi:outer membrane receptor protein involved in Fe transport
MSLDRVVVTGTSTTGTIMKQSVSISSIDATDIQNSGAASVAEILKLVPGIHSENSGGEGNINLTVRGLPISAGGSRYVQFQEDGLPVLLFGDISFGTPDEFLRADNNVDHLEVIRGGSASTLVSNAPGGVINFISKTGQVPGGTAAITLGAAGGSQRRIDVDYGARLGPKTTFHIGGFNRIGEGDRPTGYNAANGGQIKANLTQEFDSGFLRLSFKSLDDRTPTLLPVPVETVNGHVQPIPGIDPRTAYFIGPSFGPDLVIGRDGNTVATQPTDGLHVVSNSIGVEGSFKLAQGWALDDKFRKSSNSGRFIGLFPSNNGNGATPETSTTFNGVLFNTSINDLGNTFNDLKLSKTYGSGAGGLFTVTGGLFSSVQNVSLTWDWNNYSVPLQNTPKSVVLAGNGFSTFGGCCVRNFNAQYSNTAPYAALTYALGGLTVDGSVRHDAQHANGWYQSGNTVTQNSWDPASTRPIDYTVSHNAYSVGANYELSRSLATFARASDGVAFSADRLMYGNPLDGSVPVAVNEVKQIEGGVKFHTGGLNLFATLFNAKTSESNYDLTTQVSTANKYKAYGVELELGYHQGLFRLNGGATLTHSRITDALGGTNVGHTPQRLADVVFQLAPSLALGDFEGGVSLGYTGKSYGDDANQTTMPSFTAVNAFLNYNLNENAVLSASVNNLTNQIGYTEFDNISGNNVGAARSINGRTAKVSLRYNF